MAAWELTIPSSNTRDWQPQVAETPYVEINGDQVVIHNFRNFDYFSKTDFRPRWETKTVQLSHLRTVDFLTFESKVCRLGCSQSGEDAGISGGPLEITLSHPNISWISTRMT